MRGKAGATTDRRWRDESDGSQCGTGSNADDAGGDTMDRGDNVGWLPRRCMQRHVGLTATAIRVPKLLVHKTRRPERTLTVSR